MIVKNARVLVTGADGFIGSHLAEALLRLGARVRALVQYNSLNSWGWLDDSPHAKEIEIIAGDIRDPHFCLGLTKNIDVVFHLAALIPIPYSYRAPDSYVDTNVKGTLNLCQAARDSGVSRFVHTSTSEVYGSARYVPIDENHPLTPQSPYSATKIAADSVALSFFYAFALPVTVARPFNTYGPRQSARAVIPTIMTQIASGKTAIALGNLLTTRDFTFVEDTCRGFIAVASLDDAGGQTYNIGSNDEISITDLVSLIAEIMGVSATAVPDPERLRPEASEVSRLRCDNSKLANACGFVPSIPLRQGLALTAEWFGKPENLIRYKGHLYNV